MKKYLILLTALVIAATLTVSPASAAVETLDLGWNAAPEQPEAFDALPAPEADSATKVAYTDDNIVGGSIYYNPKSGTIVDCDTNVISCVIPSEIDGVKITAIGPRAFDSTDLVKVTIPEGIISIGEDGFRSTDLQSVTVPESVASIGNDAFSWTPLKSAEVLGACSIGGGAFSVSDLEKVNISRAVSIGDSCFYNCRSLYSVSLPDTLEEIPNSAFQFCEALQSIKLPSALKKIGNKAFASAGLTSGITLPIGLQSIGEDAFRESTLSGTVVIPDTVTEIGASAFRECSIASVTIPGSVKNIPDYAFNETESLIVIKMNEGVESIGKSAFYVTISNSINGYLNRQVYIPASMQFVLEGAFANFFSDDQTIGDVYYGGCENKWNTIVFGANNQLLTSAPIHFADHNYQYTYDDSSHWLACTFCGLVSGEKSPHTPDGSGVCTVCGHGKQPEHVHTETYGTDTHVHWTKCDVCGESWGVEEHVLGEDGVCEICHTKPSATGSGIRGDLNSDGNVNVTDGVTMQRILAGLE